MRVMVGGGRAGCCSRAPNPKCTPALPVRCGSEGRWPSSHPGGCNSCSPLPPLSSPASVRARAVHGAPRAAPLRPRPACGRAAARRRWRPRWPPTAGRPCRRRAPAGQVERWWVGGWVGGRAGACAESLGWRSGATGRAAACWCSARARPPPRPAPAPLRALGAAPAPRLLPGLGHLAVLQVGARLALELRRHRRPHSGGRALAGRPAGRDSAAQVA